MTTKVQPQHKQNPVGSTTPKDVFMVYFILFFFFFNFMSDSQFKNYTKTWVLGLYTNIHINIIFEYVDYGFCPFPSKELK